MTTTRGVSPTAPTIAPATASTTGASLLPMGRRDRDRRSTRRQVGLSALTGLLTGAGLTAPALTAPALAAPHLPEVHQPSPGATTPTAPPAPPAHVALSPRSAPPAPPARPVEVAAYYFPNFHRDPRNDAWYGEGWTEWELVKSAQPRFDGHRQPLVPEWGYFDEADPSWAAHEITLAARHGISAFLYDWYWYEDRPYLQGALESGFLHAPNTHQLKFALMWANHDWQHIQPARAGGPFPTLAPGAVNAEEFDRLADYVVERYFTRSNYLTIDGAPYFSIYDLATFVKGLGGVEPARAALARFREKVRPLGFGDLHLKGVVWVRNPTLLQNDAARLPELVDLATGLGLSSVSSYTWFHYAEKSAAQFPRLSMESLATAYQQWCARCRRFPLDYHPNATMGWDPSPRTHPADSYEPRGYPWTAVVDDATPGAFRRGLQQARAYVERAQPSGASQRLVTLNAWNEWTEGSYLLPEAKYGTAYLEAVRDVFGT